MHKLNGKMIPGTQPPVRFKLNHNSNRLLPGEKNHSIWVGDLTPEVDDLSLYRFFSARFQSIVSAKGNWPRLNRCCLLFQEFLRLLKYFPGALFHPILT